jgi:hypothetical protein
MTFGGGNKMDLNAIPKEAYGLIGTMIGASIGILQIG